MADIDFEVEIRSGVGREYEVAVIRSPAGEARQPMVFPFDELALQVRLQTLEIALLRSGGARRRLASDEERTVEAFGAELFDALITGEVRSRFDMSRSEAQRQGKALRVRLRFESPGMAALPWEFLFDTRRGEYLVLSTNTPLVRYIELPERMEPFAVSPPLRMLALVASPNDLPHLDGERERLRVDAATKELQDRGLLEVEWLSGATWRHIQAALRRGEWNIFHFVGHGGFDPNTDEGVVALVNDEGGTFRLAATELGRLLGDHYPLRLAVLNACEGARGSKHDLFSSTAATLVRRGTPAVVAMQYEITDRAAIEFSRSFYEAITDGLPVDRAMSESRKAVSVAINNTLEWGTPVLFMRSADGVLFKLRRSRRTSVPPQPTRTAPSVLVSPPGEPAEAGATVAGDVVADSTSAIPVPPLGAASFDVSPAVEVPDAGKSGITEVAASVPATEPEILVGDTGADGSAASAFETQPIEPPTPDPTRIRLGDSTTASAESVTRDDAIAPASADGKASEVTPLDGADLGRDQEVETRLEQPVQRSRRVGLFTIVLVGVAALVAAVAFAQAGLLGGQQNSGAGPTASTAQAPSPGRTAARTSSPGVTIAPKQPAVAIWAQTMGLRMAFGSALGRTTTTPDGLAEVQLFTGGRVYRIKASDVKAPIYGSLQDNWLQRGGPPLELGYPVDEERRIEGQPYQAFERGYLLCVPFGPGCAVYLTKPVYRAWADYRGQLGYPTQDAHTRSGITGARFERGVVYERPVGGPVVCTRSGENVTVISPSPAPAGSREVCATFK
jgi:hypothetical protein